jgi:histidinol-phosphatase (PHP family)
MFPADLHVHSTFSCDARDSMETICAAALEKGLTYLGFAEHLDYNPQDYGFGYFNYAKYSEEIERLRDKYAGRLRILKGLEFGEPHLHPREFEEQLAHDYDYILGSIHCLGNDFVGEPKLLEHYNLESFYQTYYEEVRKAVEFGGFDVLAHLDFPKRYLKKDWYDEEFLADLMKLLAQKGIGLEINTSSLRKGLNECCPGIDKVGLYVREGGKMLILGSDAHCSADIGSDFERVSRGLKEELGGAFFGIFEGREFMPL